MKTIKGRKDHQRKPAKTRRVPQRKPPPSGPVCRLCFQEAGDPETFGEFLQKDGLGVHYFCLILSSKLPQRGQSNRGFHGFLPEDIRKEIARAARKVCFVCKRKGAAIHCQKERCGRNFHLPCGRQRGCLSQFFGEYKTSSVDPWGRNAASCAVKSCPRPAWRTFRARAAAEPSTTASASRDAAWELEPGAYAELYQRYQHCDAPTCLCEQGRDCFEDEGRWCLVLCATCGSQGTHRDCSALRSNDKRWECEECAPSASAADAPT
ncbi:PHD finger protein 7 isoform X2 [Echinops telfairi]|uniref:PHD finger protein 7 isoform X2 n=1 Tax=Echinops telfairi TaxID=9371 RepID=A0AC55DNZ8_ECHTE|nr:PHD finger protein 7 isoform X2 [Echinops telfairi]